MIQRKIPMRRCVGCMESKPKRSLIRIVKTRDGAEFDPTGKANGRGVYLCKKVDCFNLARKKRAINRGLDVSLNEELLNRLLETLEEVFDCEH